MNQPQESVTQVVQISKAQFVLRNCNVPIHVAARSKAWFCGRSLAWTAGSNPAVDMHICLLCYV